MGDAEFLADFHIHSRYSRATSKQLNLDNLQKAALQKGITVVGTGDFTHPGWMEEIQEKLVPAEEGLFKLREDLAGEVNGQVPSSCTGKVRFLLTAEISSIYKKDDQVRKVHNLLFAPSLDVALKITGRLERIGNIASDGRPILGLDSRDLLEIVLESSPLAFLVPAHIWTPWFSVLGSKSGFDSLDACFEDLSGEIFSVETGLSSDPAMNWRLSALDRYSLMSNSDAHSPDKLGREANRFACALSFADIKDALRTGRGSRFLGTVEFFPEQGKYHMDGHRKCDCRMHPAETLETDCICPVCGKKVTVGVMHRVEVLADRAEGEKHSQALPYERMISLAEVVGEAKGAGPQTKGVRMLCQQIIQRLGPELFMLARVPLEDIRQTGGPLLAEGIRRMRAAEVRLDAGYDGEFGVVRLFEPGEREELGGQMTLLGLLEPNGQQKTAPKKKRKKKTGKKANNGAEPAEAIDTESKGFSTEPEARMERTSARTAGLLDRLNPEQRKAVLFSGAPLLLIAGPGTGKTLTLTCRIAYRVREQGIPAHRILAVTFTQRAAREMEERLRSFLGTPDKGNAVHVGTFHALGAEFLRDAGDLCGVPRDFSIIGSEEQRRLLKRTLPSLSQKDSLELLEKISLAKRDLVYPEDGEQGFSDENFFFSYQKYQQVLGEYKALDYDDLVACTVRALEHSPAFRERVGSRFEAVSVDEYQDVNHAQYRLLKLLASSVRDLCVIGDPQQAIYGFRGASPRYFLEFEKDYPKGEIIRLVRNYRSTKSILSASSGMLSSGLKSREAPALISSLGEGPRVCRVELNSEKSEAIFIAQTIESLMGGTDSLSIYADKVSDQHKDLCSSFGDVAVLYRLKALAPVLEKALQYQGIPTQGASRADRWETKEGSTLLAVLKWMRDPNDRLAWEQIQAGCKKDASGILSGMERFRRKRIQMQCSPREWILGLPELEWIPFQDESWKETWEMLLRAAAAFGSNWEVLFQSLSLSRSMDFMETRSERVTLATLHAAKGLEYSVVFIVGCEDSLLPCQVGGESVDPQEERRLFYVGMTRACRLLYLTHVRSRFLYGERRAGKPSPFLGEIPEKTVEKIRLIKKEGKKKGSREEQPLLFKFPDRKK